MSETQNEKAGKSDRLVFTWQERFMARAEWTQADLDAHLRRMDRRPCEVPDPTPVEKPKSKYRNVKTQADGLMFDSRREADYWLVLRARQDLGEIRELRRQVDFPLLCPAHDFNVGVTLKPGINTQVSSYVADFVYIDCKDGSRHVVDAKGHRTREYLLKRKWLELQDAITIEEV